MQKNKKLVVPIKHILLLKPASKPFCFLLPLHFYRFPYSLCRLVRLELANDDDGDDYIATNSVHPVQPKRCRVTAVWIHNHSKGSIMTVATAGTFAMIESINRLLSLDCVP